MTNEVKKKPFYKKWWVWVLAVVLFLGFIGSMGEEGVEQSASSSSSDVSSGNSDSSSDKSEPEKSATIGTPLKVGDVEFTVNGISSATNVGGQYGANSQGVFLLVDVTVTNLGKEAITTDSSLFKLLVEDMEFEADSTATMYAGADASANFFLEQVNPTLSLTGTVVFDVSQSVINSSDLMLQVQTGAWGTETGNIKLK